jgi:hypothetical protein
LLSERCATWLRNRLTRPSAVALTTRAKAAFDLRERQNEGRRLLRKQAEKFIRYRIDDANRSSALAGMGGSRKAVDDLRVTHCRRRPRAPNYRKLAARSCTNRRAARGAGDPGTGSTSGCLPDLEACDIFVGLRRTDFPSRRTACTTSPARHQFRQRGASEFARRIYFQTAAWVVAQRDLLKERLRGLSAAAPGQTLRGPAAKDVASR